MGYADDGDVVLADLIHVLQVRRLHEGIDAGEVRQFTSRKRGDVAINDALSRLQAETLGLINFLLPTR